MSRKRELLKRLRGKKKKRKRKLRKPKPIFDKNEVLKLKSFQKDGVKWIERNNFRCILADAQGTGKTIQAISVIARNSTKLTPTLVVCPSSVVWNWERECIRWIKGIKVHCVDDQTTPLPEQNPHITICSWDILVYRLEEFTGRGYTFVIGDECHYIKNPFAKRTEAFLAVTEGIKYMMLMSGTPLVNNEYEFEFIKNIVGEDTPVLRRILGDVDKKVPDKKRIRVPVELPPKIRKEYNDIINNFGGFIESYLKKLHGNSIDIEEKVEALTQSQYLAKITYLRRLLGRAKAPVVAQWTKRMIKKGEPVVVFAEHQEILDMYCGLLSKSRIKYVRYDGSTNRTNRQIAIDAFQLGRVDVIVCSKSGCEGITLTRSCNIAFLEMFWTPAISEQAEDRLHRMGQSRVTNVWLFEVLNSYDVRINAILDAKREIFSTHLSTETVTNANYGRTVKGSSPKELMTLTERPKLVPDFPRLPHRKFVKGIIFDPYEWAMDLVQKSLKRRGYKIRKVVERKNGAYIDLRASEQFAHTRWDRQKVRDGFIVLTGTPIRRERERVKKYRQKR